jgi:hypothetical protein
MIFLNYDLSDYNQYKNTKKVLLGNENLANLLNANALGNLPSVNITSNNSMIDQLQRCRDGPIFIGKNGGSEFVCRNLCGSNGRLLEVRENEEIFVNNERLTPGFWCTLTRPNCNLNTTFAVATANSVACNSRYPRIFGGQEGNDMVACNNLQYSNIGNMLWDDLRNQRVTEFTQFNSDEDELLPSGLFRFTCRFTDDDNGNAYISHFVDRLHPMRNYCTQDLFEGSRAITMRPDTTCDCGDYQNTRVKNRFANDTKSDCTNCFFNYNRSINQAQIGTKCFTNRSPYRMAFDFPPCMPSEINGKGNFCQSISLNLFEDNGLSFPNHPISFNGRPIQCQEFEITN